MEIQFLGGAGEVGRSAFLLKDEKNILLDYGAKNGTPRLEYPLIPSKVDAVVVSHAHFDHTGALPIIYDTEFPIAFGTKPTKDLSELLLEDSLGISKKQGIKPKYSKMQMKNYLRRYMSYDYNSEIDFANYTISFKDAGHITGSAISVIEKNHNGKRLVYTGDFKLQPQILQKGGEIVDSDILMIESTYATRSHPDRGELIKKFIEDVKATLDNGGTALVPVFAVGRAQEIIAILYQHGLIDYTYMDGMAKKASEIVMKYPEFTPNRELLLRAMKNCNWIGEHYDRTAAMERPSVIVTTAGMLNGGPVLHYITKLNENSRIMLTGYQVEGTNGRLLLDKHPLDIDDQKILVNTPATYYDFSAHASKEDIYNYVRESNPETVICIHGDKQNTESLAETLKLEGFDAHAPKYGEKMHLDF